MEYDCFSCIGVRQECVEKRKFVPYSDTYDCLYYIIARMDLKKFEKGDLQTITMKQMLATHLSNNGEKQKALEILTSH